MREHQEMIDRVEEAMDDFGSLPSFPTRGVKAYGVGVPLPGSMAVPGAGGSCATIAGQIIAVENTIANLQSLAALLGGFAGLPDYEGGMKTEFYGASEMNTQLSKTIAALRARLTDLRRAYAQCKSGAL